MSTLRSGGQKMRTSLRICAQVGLAACLVLPLTDPPLWRLTLLSLFFAYNYFLYPEWGVVFTALYSCSFATLLWYVWFPFDLALLNGLVVQTICVQLTGTTLHHWLAERLTGSRVPEDSPT